MAAFIGHIQTPLLLAQRRRKAGKKKPTACRHSRDDEIALKVERALDLIERALNSRDGDSPSSKYLTTSVSISAGRTGPGKTRMVPTYYIKTVEGKTGFRIYPKARMQGKVGGQKRGTHERGNYIDPN